MSPSRVSCIVPVYNGERFLREAIESILGQTYRPMEIIVVDDGSTDASAEVAESIGPPVVMVRRLNQGPGAARNTGVAASHGDLVAFLDADDLWLSNKLELQVREMEAHPHLGFCVGHIQNFWIEEVQAEAKAFAGHRFAEPLPGFVFPTVLCRKEIFERVGPIESGVRGSEDVDWFLRAIDLGVPHVLLQDLLVRRRLHLGNFTRADLASRDVLIRSVKASLDRRRRKSP